MRPTLFRSVFFAAVMFGLGTGAHAESFGADTKGTWTSISGDTGTNTDQSTWADKGIRTMIFYENGDIPSIVESRNHSLCSTGCTSYSTGDARIKKLLLKIPATKAVVSVGDARYVRAIQVCTKNTKHSSKNRLKGVRIWGAKIGKKGKVIDLKEPYLHFERPNCPAKNGWRNIASCGAGKVATGFKIHFTSVQQGITGISLYCKKPQPR